MEHTKNPNIFLKPGLQFCSLYKFIGIIFLLVGLIVLFPGCFAPVFSDTQSARLVGPGHIEVTPSFSWGKLKNGVKYYISRHNF